MIRLIVPRRADHGHRDRLWSFCRAGLERVFSPWLGFEIVEGHHDEGPFNRSAAINSAAVGSWEIAVILDGDVLVPAAAIMKGVAHALKTGRMVLPFTDRHLLSAAGTDRLLGRGVPEDLDSLRRFVTGTERNNVSTAVIVRRDLFEQVGGFDERFVGWGGEDNAFAAACKAFAGLDRIPGPAWHLWHEASPERDHTSPLYRCVRLLADRYERTVGAGAMRRLLDEPRGPEQTVAVCLTTGTRPAELDRTLATFDENVSGPIGRRVLVLDSTRGDVRLRISRDHRGWEVAPITGKTYARAVGRALDVAIGSGQPWVFWTEDDFTFDEPIDIAAMQALMNAAPELVQLSLKRQAWYPHELAAGGIIEAKPEAFRSGPGYVTHRDYWTQNPYLARRSLLAAHQWPARPPDTERRFGVEVFAADPGRVAGILGALDDPPKVTHIGRRRAGTGY